MKPGTPKAYRKISIVKVESMSPSQAPTRPRSFSLLYARQHFAGIPMQWELVVACTPRSLMSFFIARNNRAELTIAALGGSTIFSALLIQYFWASASAALGSTALCASMTWRLEMGTISQPRRFFTSSGVQAAFVPLGAPTTRIRVFFMRPGTASNCAAWAIRS